MSLENSGGQRQVRLLPLWPILRTACQFPWQHRRQVRRLLIIPIILSIIVTVLILYLAENKDAWGGTVLYSSSFLYAPIFTFFAVSYHRSILIGDNAVHRFGIPAWTMRETRFLFWSIAMYFIAFAFLALVGIAAGLLAFSIGGIIGDTTTIIKHLTSGYILNLLFLVPLAYVVGRISVILPAIAVDLRPTFNWAMSLSQGNGWRVALLVGGTPLVFWGLYSFILESLGLFTDVTADEAVFKLNIPSAVIYGLQQIVYYAWLTIEVAILSFTFRFLSQNVESTPSPQELA